MIICVRKTSSTCDNIVDINADVVVSYIIIVVIVVDDAVVDTVVDTIVPRGVLKIRRRVLIVEQMRPQTVFGAVSIQMQVRSRLGLRLVFLQRHI